MGSVMQVEPSTVSKRRWALSFRCMKHRLT